MKTENEIRGNDILVLTLPAAQWLNLLNVSFISILRITICQCHLKAFLDPLFHNLLID